MTQAHVMSKRTCSKFVSGSSDVADVIEPRDLLRLLECPVCTDIPFPPINICSKGHNVCHNCQPKLKTCPLCTSPFTDARNYFMESIVLSSKFYCYFASNGCREMIVGDRFQDHVKQCSYRNGPKKVKENASCSTSAKPRVPTATLTSRPPTSGSSNANQGTSSNGVRRIAGCCQWIPSSVNDEIPQDAVAGGIEHGSRLYIARAKHSSGLYPGKLHSERRTLSLPWGGRERIKNEYEVLISMPEYLRWEGGSYGLLPANALVAGRVDSGEALYIGRCGHNGTMAVGWLLPKKQELKISSDGKEFSYRNYEILVKTEAGIAKERQHLSQH